MRELDVAPRVCVLCIGDDEQRAAKLALLSALKRKREGRSDMGVYFCPAHRVQFRAFLHERGRR